MGNMLIILVNSYNLFVFNSIVLFSADNMTAHVSMTPRPLTSGSGPRMHLPVIEHPMSRLGDHNSLSISGEMTRLGLSAREQTFVTLGEDGRLHMGLDRTGLPPLGSRTSSACSMLSAGHPGRYRLITPASRPVDINDPIPTNFTNELFFVCCMS
jgi:hypothetical protein